jgi:3-deoxy-D-arabino-heptulosonate 7-phosphate (DAHP) synthase class II
MKLVLTKDAGLTETIKLRADADPEPSLTIDGKIFIDGVKAPEGLTKIILLGLDKVTERYPSVLSQLKKEGMEIL